MCMCVCMCVRAYVYMCVCVYAGMCVCVLIIMYVRASMCVFEASLEKWIRSVLVHGRTPLSHTKRGRRNERERIDRMR